MIAAKEVLSEIKNEDRQGLAIKTESGGLRRSTGKDRRFMPDIRHRDSVAKAEKMVSLGIIQLEQEKVLKGRRQIIVFS